MVVQAVLQRTLRESLLSHCSLRNEEHATLNFRLGMACAGHLQRGNTVGCKHADLQAFGCLCVLIIQQENIPCEW